MDTTMMQDGEIQELLQFLRLFQKEKEAGEVFELVAYIDGLENKLGQVMDELATVKKKFVEIRELNEKKSLKEVLSDTVEKLEENCKQMKENLIEIKNGVKEKASPASYEGERQDFIETHVAESSSYRSNSEAFEAFQNAYEKNAGSGTAID
ncbi:hypothetical protein LQZ18_11130 [Lachnospiraceae bacterium ZAX-1]